MKISETLTTTWAELEAKTNTKPPDSEYPYVEQRVFAHSGFNLMAGLSHPGNRIFLALRVPLQKKFENLDRETRGFIVTQTNDRKKQESTIRFTLRNRDFRRLFEVVAEDLVAHILSAKDQPSSVRNLGARLEHWERFLEISGEKGLGPTEQIGLYGELVFLRILLRDYRANNTGLEIWTGPEGANQDFQFESQAVEVKTTSGNSPTEMQISNELQLDETDCSCLFLAHNWVRRTSGSGETLPDIVADISSLLDEGSRPRFLDKLARVGYHEMHRSSYSEYGYTERRKTYYRVMGTLPRIRRGNLLPGVDNVNYRINVAGFQDHECGEATVLSELLGVCRD